MNLRFLRRASGRALLVGGMTLGLIGAGAAVASAATPQTNNWYVATTGHDTTGSPPVANSCGSSSSPCLTIGHAIYEQGLSATTGIIHVAAGTYPEAVTATNLQDGVTIKGASAKTTIIAPSPAAISAEVTAYNANNSNPLYADTDSTTPQIYAVTASPGTTGFNLKNLTVSGLSAIPEFDSDGLGCGQDFVGIYYHEASGTLKNVDVNGIDMPEDLYGCQSGQGIYVNSSSSAGDSANVTMTDVNLATPLSTSTTTASLLAGSYTNDVVPVVAVPAGWHSGEVTVGGYDVAATKDNHTSIYITTNTTGNIATKVKNHSTVVFNAEVTSYDKNGITCDDAYTTCTISGSAVEGSGAQSAIAQNGVQFFGNDNGTINSTSVSENGYSLGTAGNAATGILIIDGGTVNVGNSADNTVSSNDVDIYAGDIPAYESFLAEGYPTLGTWTIGGQGNIVSDAIPVGASDANGTAASGYGIGIQVDGTTNPVDVYSNTVTGSASAGILLTGAEDATIGNTGEGNTLEANEAGLVLAGPSSQCETYGVGSSQCNYGTPGAPGTQSPGWASYNNTIIANTVGSSNASLKNLAGVVSDGTFAPNVDGLSQDPNAAYNNTFSSNIWSGTTGGAHPTFVSFNILANAIDFSGQADYPPQQDTYSAGSSANSCTPSPGGSASTNGFLGPNATDTGVTLTPGSPATASMSGAFGAGVYPGSLVVDTTTPGNVSEPNYVTSGEGTNTLDLSGTVTAATSDSLNFYDDWAC
jgi:hypothetical protein